jgi:hypothetical protein
MTAKKKSPKKEHTYQLYDNVWYRSAHGRPPYRHECCDCSLVHNIEYKFEQGSVWEKWTVDTQATVKARRDKKDAT